MSRPDPARTPLAPTSQYIEADDDDDDSDDLDEDAIPGYSVSPVSPRAPQLDKGKARGPPEQLAPPSGLAGTSAGAPAPALSGNIGSGAGAQRPARTTVGGVKVESRYTGTDTLDEPVMTTIARDAFSIYNKLVQVLYPIRSGQNREVLKDWDLWGPLILCLTLALMISMNAPANQSLGVFTGVIVLITVGSLVVTVQAKLLGGRISFFQGLCVLGYCVAPLNIAALISSFVRIIYVRAPVSLAAWAWCVWAAMNFFDGSKIEQQRILLAVYPLLLFYFILAWMILIQ